MTSTDTDRPAPTDITLSDVVLETLTAAMVADPMRGLESLWAELLAPATFADYDTIDPTRYTLPDNQWRDLCEAMIRAGGVGAGLTFMNIGPSSR